MKPDLSRYKHNYPEVSVEKFLEIYPELKNKYYKTINEGQSPKFVRPFYSDFSIGFCFGNPISCKIGIIIGEDPKGLLQRIKTYTKS